MTLFKKKLKEYDQKSCSFLRKMNRSSRNTQLIRQEKSLSDEEAVLKELEYPTSQNSS